MSRLKSVRKDYKISRAELAKQTGLGLSTIGSYERGSRTPRIKAASLIVSALSTLSGGQAQETIDSLFSVKRAGV